jgi:SAM-dependent methyltransferase
LKGFLYNKLIDPLLSGLRDEIIKQAGKSERVIDIACGTGTLAINLAKNTGNVTGIDLDEDFISYATLRINKHGINNVKFEGRDASDLSIYLDKEFDIAVTSMSMHQFHPQLAVKILSEMKRIANVVIIGDYNFPLPKSISGAVAYSMERLAGGDHYINFINYISLEGIKHYASSAGLNVRSESLKSNGTFSVVVCE